MTNPLDAAEPGPSYDQTVTIYLDNGQIIRFTADWNFGLVDFVNDYEACMRNGTPQPHVRYQMQDTTTKKNSHVNVMFKNIVALHLTKP